MIRVNHQSKTTEEFEQFILNCSPISPNELKNKNGQIFENIWQFNKVYQQVPKTEQYFSRYDRRICWKHPAEVHLNQDNPNPNPNPSLSLTPEFYLWREKGLNCPFPVRYPAGLINRGKHLFFYFAGFQPSATNFGDHRMTQSEAHKELVAEYLDIVKNHTVFHELKEKLANGINILIIDPSTSSNFNCGNALAMALQEKSSVH